jgi:hypothetical protein
MAASTNQQSASVIVTDDPRTRAKTLLLRHELWRRRQERPPFPHRYAERRQRSGSLLRIHQVPRSHDPDLCRFHQKAAEKFEGQEGRNLGVVLDYEMKKRLFRDLAKRGPGRTSSEQKHLVAERHGLQVVRGKIPVPDIRIEYEARDGERARVASNSPPVTTGEEIWRKKSPPDSPSTTTQKMLRNSGPCWISVN